MKVMQLINSLGVGGAEALVKDYVTHFPPDVESVVVVTNLLADGPNEAAIQDAGIKILSISERLGWGGKRRSLPVRAVRCLLENRLFIREFKKILQEEKPQCIHAHLDVLSILAGCIHELRDIRVLYTCHNEVPFIFPPSEKHIIRAAKKLIHFQNMQIIALHDRMAQELNTVFGEGSSFSLNNCIDMQRFREVEPSLEIIRKELGIPADSFVIGHIGRFQHQKNQPFLVEIFRELQNQNVNAFLLMIGSGDTQQSIREQLKDYGLQDHSLILQNREDIPQLMKTMDVFVFPSLYEGFPIVLLEAQAAGLKCVISNSISESTMLTNLVIPVSLDESPAHWCDVILSDTGREPGSLAKLEQYDIHTVLKQLKEVYEAANT